MLFRPRVHAWVELAASYTCSLDMFFVIDSTVDWFVHSYLIVNIYDKIWQLTLNQLARLCRYNGKHAQGSQSE